MKEATGELSMTAVVVVIIGILAVALPIIINRVVDTMERNAMCSAAFGCDTSACTINEDGTAEGVMTCHYVPEDGGPEDEETITCGCKASTLE